MTGHVFALRGDLTALACDALVVPTSYDTDVTPPWLPVVEALPVAPSGWSDWWHVNVKTPEGWGDRVRTFRSPADSRGRQVWFCLSGVGGNEPGWVAGAVVEAVRAAGASVRRTSARAVPLVGIPLAGTGAGGLQHRRGAVIDALLPELVAEAARSGVDVALVLADDRDHAAVQSRRESPGAALLSPDQCRRADELGERAARQELVLFLGAGASIAAGLPSWKQLLAELAQKAGFGPEELASLPAPDAAQVAATRMGAAFGPYMRERFTLDRHALAHSLLAGLGVDAAVTTNYDNAYELAMSGCGRDLSVLPAQRAEPGQPWLLKLHGDAARPESIVLTRVDYLEHARSSAPLAGLVQALLMTRHMLFVGFSLIDDNFARLAHEVRRVLGDGGRPVGTVLSLVRDAPRELLWQGALEHEAMLASGDERQAARLLEVFLDRLAWRAATTGRGSEAYLLDPRYAAMQRSPGEDALRARLRALDAGATAEERQSPAWRHVETMLHSLGGRRPEAAAGPADARMAQLLRRHVPVFVIGRAPAAVHPPAPVDRARCRGALLAVAAGDALGRPAETLPVEEVRRRWGQLRDFVPWRGWTGGPKGTWTDDTQLTLVLAESLLATGTLDPDDVARRLVAWLPGARGAGRATRAAVGRLAAGTPWWQAGEASDGNGAAMRVAPVALRYPSGGPDLCAAAALSAWVTHASPMATASAVVQAAMVAACLRAPERSMTPDLLLGVAAAAGACVDDRGAPERRPGADARPVRLVDRLLEVPSLLHLSPDDAFARLHNGAFVLESLPAAVWCFLASPEDPERVLVTAASGGRDADTVAAMAGALVGAYVGEDRLPGRWTGEDLEEATRIRALADRLWEATQSRAVGPAGGSAPLPMSAEPRPETGR